MKITIKSILHCLVQVINSSDCVSLAVTYMMDVLNVPKDADS